MNGNRVRVDYHGSNSQSYSVKVRRPGQCALCPSTWGLSQHHLFGKSERFTAVVCMNCHHVMHQEVNNGQVGPFSRHLLHLLAAAFPLTAPLPEWTSNAR